MAGAIGRIGRIGQGRRAAAAERPRTVWDFAGGDHGPFRAFARTGAGTAFRADGTLAEFASGVARITDRGLLLEQAATNLHPRWREPDWSGAGANPPTAAPATVDGYPGAAVTFPAGSGGYADSRARGQAHAIVARGASFTVQSMVRLSRPLEPTEALKIYWTGTGGMPENFVTGVEWMRRQATTTFGGSGEAQQYPLVYRSALLAPCTVYVTHHQLETGGVATSPIPTTGAAATRGADSASLTTPAGCTAWRAVHGAGGTETGGEGLTPGQPFDLVGGRPWIGVGNELRRLEFLP